MNKNKQTGKDTTKRLKALIAQKQKPRWHKKKLVSMKALKRKADKIFSWWIRDRDNHCCFTCGKILSPKESQNGHFISRQHTSTRYSERNCSCQCVSCNIFLKGNYPVYALRLQQKYGNDILQELDIEKHKTVKCDREFLTNIIKTYEKI